MLIPYGRNFPHSLSLVNEFTVLCGQKKNGPKKWPRRGHAVMQKWLTEATERVKWQFVYFWSFSVAVRSVDAATRLFYWETIYTSSRNKEPGLYMFASLRLSASVTLSAGISDQIPSSYAIYIVARQTGRYEMSRRIENHTAVPMEASRIQRRFESRRSVTREPQKSSNL